MVANLLQRMLLFHQMVTDLTDLLLHINVGSEIKVDQSIEQALTEGATLSKAAQKTSWVGYSGYFKDPEGYLREVAFSPFFWVGPEDENE